MIGKRLGKFEIKAWIGGGQFADVFLAFDTVVKRDFAIKVSRARERDIRGLVAEAQVLAALEHPNIVRFYSADVIEGRLVIVMEFVEGKSLRALLDEEGRLSVPRALTLIYQVLDALEFAHSKGILHRDVKPENILVAKGDRVKLTDFGLAALVNPARLSASMAGTPLYMAPEAWEGKHTVQTDVWAAAAVLYEALAGHPPFYDETYEGLRKKIRAGKPKPITGVPAELDRAIREALSPDPEARPASAKAFRERLEAAAPKEVKPLRPAAESPATPPELAALSEEQREAVLHEGHLLLLGGVGSGKTTALVARAAHWVLRHGVEPEAVFLATFTGKAAGELRERLAAYLSEGQLRRVWLGTLHYLAAKIASAGAEREGYPEELVVLDEREVHEILWSLAGNEERARAFAREISRAKARLLTPEEYEERARGSWQHQVARVYREYQRVLREMRALDKDDVITLALRVLKHEDILQDIAGRLKLVLIDEFQDLNLPQYLLVKRLASGGAWLAAAADDSQAIYGFRGASTEFIRRFRGEFSPKVILMSKNFRNYEEILSLARNLISRNPESPRPVFAVKSAGREVVHVHAAEDPEDEARFVADTIAAMVEEGRSWEDFAVLFRTHAQGRRFEDLFARRRIPFNLEGASSFYRRPEIRASLGFLKLLLGQATPEDAAWVLRKFLGFKPREARLATRNTLRTKKFTFSKKLDDAKREAMKALWEFALAQREHLASLSPAQILEELYQFTGYAKTLEEASSPARLAERDNIQELLELARGFGRGGTGDLLAHVSLTQTLAAQVRGVGGVRLMTFHGAKGLEFPVVFLTGMADGLFPSARAIAKPRELAEERRLCYVALTRALEEVFITYPKRERGRYFQPSRFIYEMFSLPEGQ